MRLPTLKAEPYFKAVSVTSPLDIMAAAHLANISESEFLQLNPAFKTPVFIPKSGRKMLLPVQAAKTFEENYRESDPKTLLSWNVFTVPYRMSLSEIAEQTGDSILELKRLNGISGNYVNAGRSILVNKNTMTNFTPFTDFIAKNDVDTTPDTFVEQAPILGANGLASVQPTLPAVLTNENTKTLVTDNSMPSINIQTVQNPQTQLEKPIVQVAQNPQTLPEKSSVQMAENTENNADDLMQLVNHSQALNAPIPDQLAVQAAEAVRASIAQSDAEEARTNAIAAKKRAAEEAKKQQIAAAERAKAEAAEKAAKAEAAKYSGSHKVGSKDTLYSIAKRYDMTVDELKLANKLRDNTVHSGDVLRVLGKGKVDKKTDKANLKSDKNLEKNSKSNEKFDKKSDKKNQSNMKLDKNNDKNNQNNIKSDKKNNKAEKVMPKNNLKDEKKLAQKAAPKKR